VLGFLPLITGLTRVCPVYPLFGFNTCPAPPPEAESEAESEAGAAPPAEAKPPTQCEPGKAT
jgi:hypothetical protein